MNREFDVIDQESYKSGYTAGALESYVLCRNRFSKNLEREYWRMLYFLKQKLYGLLLAIFTVFAVVVLNGDATIAVFTVPISVLLIFSRKMILVKDFYWRERDCGRRNRAK